MAIINQGQILLEAEPLRAVDELRGRIWQRIVTKEALPEIERDLTLISTKLLAGRRLVRVDSPSIPAAGFEPAAPNLEDVYFCVMAGRQRGGDSEQQPMAARA
jgi:hypothetical protein